MRTTSIGSRDKAIEKVKKINNEHPSTSTIRGDIGTMIVVGRRRASASFILVF
jgi:hypothetical protein